MLRLWRPPGSRSSCAYGDRSPRKTGIPMHTGAVCLGQCAPCTTPRRSRSTSFPVTDRSDPRKRLKNDGSRSTVARRPRCARTSAISPPTAIAAPAVHVVWLQQEEMPAIPPNSLADFWNVENFPAAVRCGAYAGWTVVGRRQADGVAQRFYPSRRGAAFRSLDRIQPYVKVWCRTIPMPSMLMEQEDRPHHDGERPRPHRSTPTARAKIVWNGRRGRCATAITMDGSCARLPQPDRREAPRHGRTRRIPGGVARALYYVADERRKPNRAARASISPKLIPTHPTTRRSTALVNYEWCATTPRSVSCGFEHGCSLTRSARPGPPESAKSTERVCVIGAAMTRRRTTAMSCLCSAWSERLFGSGGLSRRMAPTHVMSRRQWSVHARCSVANFNTTCCGVIAPPRGENIPDFHIRRARGLHGSHRVMSSYARTNHNSGGSACGLANITVDELESRKHAMPSKERWPGTNQDMTHPNLHLSDLAFDRRRSNP